MKILYSIQYFYETRVSLKTRLYFLIKEYNLERLEKYLKDAEIKDKKIMLIFSRLLEETIVKTLY